MEKLTWTKRYGGYAAEDKLHTRRYTIRRRASQWELDVIRLEEHKFTRGEPMYLPAGGPSIHTASYSSKWRAVMHADIEEATRRGTPEDVEKLWEEYANRIMGAKKNSEEERL